MCRNGTGAVLCWAEKGQQLRQLGREPVSDDRTVERVGQRNGCLAAVLLLRTTGCYGAAHVTTSGLDHEKHKCCRVRL